MMELMEMMILISRKEKILCYKTRGLSSGSRSEYKGETLIHRCSNESPMYSDNIETYVSLPLWVDKSSNNKVLAVTMLYSPILSITRT